MPKRISLLQLIIIVNGLSVELLVVLRIWRFAEGNIGIWLVLIPMFTILLAAACVPRSDITHSTKDEHRE